MRIHIWKGYHSESVRELIARAWSRDDELLILCPPLLDSFQFVRFLPEGEITWHGEWPHPPAEVTRTPTEYPGTPVLGLFTSGTSSGQNKLVLYSKSNIRSSLEGILRFFDVSRIDSIFSYPQPFHTFGLLLGYILALEKSWPLISGTGKYDSSFHKARVDAENQGLLTLGTPTHFRDLMAFAESTGTDLRPSYSCIVGGAKVSVELWRRLKRNLKIESPSVGYGATEASPGVAHLPAGQEPLEDGEIGLPLPGLDLSLTESGYEFSGPSVCLAVLSADRIDFPKKIFIADELHCRSDGILVFHGRSDLTLNRGGEKFSLEKIESLIDRHFGLPAIACAIPDPRLGQELALLVSESADQNLICHLLQEHMGIKLNPSNVKRMTQIPLNLSQKPDRQKAQLLLEGSTP